MRPLHFWYIIPRQERNFCLHTCTHDGPTPEEVGLRHASPNSGLRARSMCPWIESTPTITDCMLWICFLKERLFGGKFRIIMLTQPQTPTLKKNSLIYSCKRILLVESTDTGNWQKYSEFSIYRRLGRSKGENILLEICLLDFFFNNSLEIGSTYEDF